VSPLPLSFALARDLYVRSWASLPDPGAPVPKEEPGLTNLFEEIRYTVEQEYRIIQAVFPNPPYVMQGFLQRVFAQSVSIACSSLNVRT
jgi:hypothetical protein